MHGQVIGVIASKLDALRVVKATGDIPQNINFAIKEAVVKSFLQAHSIPFNEATKGPALSPADVGEIAKNHTVLLQCVIPK